MANVVSPATPRLLLALLLRRRRRRRKLRQQEIALLLGLSTSSSFALTTLPMLAQVVRSPATNPCLRHNWRPKTRKKRNPRGHGCVRLCLHDVLHPFMGADALHSSPFCDTRVASGSEGIISCAVPTVGSQTNRLSAATSPFVHLCHV